MSLEKFTRIMFSQVIERLSVVISEENLSFSQVAALHIIDQAKTISIRELALRLNLTLSATSRLVDDLVKTDFLDRIEDQENRRSKILTLTRHGQEFQDKLSLERVKIFKSTAETMPEKISGHFLELISPKKGKKK